LNSFKLQYLSYFGKSFKTLQPILELKLQELFWVLLASESKGRILDFMHASVRGTPVALDLIIEKYLFQPITTKELADLSGRSLASFKRDFQKKYGASPRRWINQKRLAHAHTLLQHTGKNVTEIAYECGFENVSYFIKMFKHEYNITPNAVRAKRVAI
jgi:AraC family transcriptional regulator, exoenzyme S synthesis regulatory protein ExsA